MVSETQNINLRLVLIVCSASFYERALIHERILFQLQFPSLLNLFLCTFLFFFLSGVEFSSSFFVCTNVSFIPFKYQVNSIVYCKNTNYNSV